MSGAQWVGENLGDISSERQAGTRVHGAMERSLHFILISGSSH